MTLYSNNAEKVVFEFPTSCPSSAASPHRCIRGVGAEGRVFYRVLRNLGRPARQLWSNVKGLDVLMTGNVESTDGVITLNGSNFQTDVDVQSDALPDSWSLAPGGRDVRFTKRSKHDVLAVSRRRSFGKNTPEKHR
ncbi:hypothetical protein EYF80_050767 [Liparis tanakae]|uniref:Uncharacterized protein n=1 Tax=Liparis tanakae TaxID=230148 RepID=A0A4Z2FDK6_9TELE|nr:hypothetical protein EYF80_050767 [Liparis tanakae]